MSIRVYNWEHFERGTWRFVAFATALALLIGISIFYADLFGAIVLFLFTGAYILFSLTKSKHITLHIRDTWLAVDTRLWPRQNLTSFVVEINETSQEWKNIIIILQNNDHMIFSFDDQPEQQKTFIAELQQYIPLVESYPQNSMDKMVRKLKL